MRLSMKKIPLFIGMITLLMLASCDDGRVNVFSVNDDIQMGEEITNEILANTAEYRVLSRAQHPAAYAHLDRMRDGILNSGKLKYKDRFNWKVFIIHDDNVINAFALPGGNTFYYTGLIKFLDNEAMFQGVMAHEFAHADRRHSTTRLTKVYGYQIVLGMMLGNNPSLAGTIAADLAMGLGALAFSRKDEYDADEHAVKFLYPTEWDSRGVADFFIKLDSPPQGALMTYLSTHPSPDDRIQQIQKHWQALGGKVGQTHTDRYQLFKNSLPK